MSGESKRPTIAGSLRGAVAAVANVLSTAPNLGMLIGGIAVIARGVPRTTRDVDATVDGNACSIRTLVEKFAQEGIIPRIDDAQQFANEHQVLLMRHAPSGMDIDISVAWLPFEIEAIAASENVTLGDVRVPMARPEDLVIYKAIAWRPQDQQDVERLLLLHGKLMDLDRVRQIVGQFAEVLEDTSRLDELNRVIARACG
jgi:predicted nucleotidyltransferase